MFVAIQKRPRPSPQVPAAAFADVFALRYHLLSAVEVTQDGINLVLNPHARCEHFTTQQLWQQQWYKSTALSPGPDENRHYCFDSQYGSCCDR